MGLDVYLYRITDYKKSKANEKMYEDYSEQLWGNRKYEDVPEDDKIAIRNKLNIKANELGLGDYGEDITYKKKIELPSDLHPDHNFQIGYFRSSYNGSGINRILENKGLPTLFEIFEIEDGGEVSPNYEQALINVKEVLAELRRDKGYQVLTASGNLFSKPNVSSSAEALRIFENELETHSGFNSYSNINGEFHMGEPIKVVALIPGIETMMSERPCTYVVYKNESGVRYYIQALEVVQETIEFILAHENPQEFYMYWSG
jgi:hypothetical protein